jgi:hypothetical protein
MYWRKRNRRKEKFVEEESRKKNFTRVERCTINLVGKDTCHCVIG